MTRKGEPQRPWTVKEELHLASHAGLVPPEDLACELGRTVGALDDKLRRLNALHGTHVTLVCPGRTEVCPACGHVTALGLNGSGVCPSCHETARSTRYRDALRAAEAAYARVLETRRIEAMRVKALVDENNAAKMRKSRVVKKMRAASEQ